MLATIGYEGAELRDFIATLNIAGIEVLIDVRDRAQSRRPGFSKSGLSEALGSVGIEYLHFRGLGDPKEGREAARRGDFASFREIFGEVMKSTSAVESLVQIERILSTRRVCLMCFERDERTCHRKIVTDHLEKTLNYETRHLGVMKGAGRKGETRRVRYTHKGAAAQVEQVL